jgi:hypothetical protein
MRANASSPSRRGSVDPPRQQSAEEAAGRSRIPVLRIRPVIFGPLEELIKRDFGLVIAVR